MVFEAKTVYWDQVQDNDLGTIIDADLNNGFVIELISPVKINPPQIESYRIFMVKP